VNRAWTAVSAVPLRRSRRPDPAALEPSRISGPCSADMTLLEQFEQLRAEGINRFIAEDKEEGLHLEFKIANADLRRTEDKQNLARCLQQP
jgi:hypothetical protein